MQELIKAESIHKRYGGHTVLDGVSVAAHAGECVGIFGLSDAGKSTLMRILAGIETPDSGTVTFAERPAFSLQNPHLALDLTPAEILWLCATLCEIPRGKRHSVVREALALIGLDSQRDRRVRTLSDGARKRLEVATSLICPSGVLLLDEPMTGIDFQVRRRLWERLLSLRARAKRAVVIATSRSEDAELCDRIVLLHCGRVLAAGTTAELRGMVGPEALVIRPVSTRHGVSGRGGWSGVTGRTEEDAYIVEVGPESRPVELLRQIPGSVGAVRIDRRGMDSVLDELIARSEEGPKLE